MKKVKENKYTEINVLNEIEHIRKRPELYIGSVESPIRLFEEVLDNSIDEVINGYADEIDIKVDKDNFIIRDNGRGFPIDTDSKSVEKAFTKLFSSGKFNKNGYKISIGLHGIGLTAVYALSKSIHLITGRNKVFHEYIFDSDKDVVINKVKNFNGGTIITVYPDKKYFKSLELNKDYIIEKLNILKYSFKKCKIKFNYLGEDIELTPDYSYLFDCCDKTYELNINNDNDYLNIIFGWCKDTKNAKYLTYVNFCKCVGHHINVFIKMLNEYFDSDVDITTGFRLFMELRIGEAKFSDQIKSRLSSSSDIVKIFSKIDLDKILGKDKKKIIEQLKKVEEDKKIKKIIDTKKITKLRDNSNPKGGELIICEGESAGGCLLSARNPKVHAILPLKGVVPNILKKSDVLDNKEISDIYYSILSKNYDKIIIFCDADPAGHFIASLLLIFFYFKMENIVKEGKLYICIPPLFGYYDKQGKFVPVYKKEAVKDNVNLLRYKGLGSFNPKELREVIFGENRKLILVKFSDNSEFLKNLFTSSEKRYNLIFDSE